MRGSTFKRCACRDGVTGKRLGASCPKLYRADGRWSSDHGSWGYQHELPAAFDGRRRPHRQAGLDSATAAENGLEHVRALLALADPTDPAQARAIGDIIENATRARQPLPTVKEVSARLRTRTPTDEPPTMAEYLPAWLGGRLRLSAGTRRSYDGHIKHWLVPQLGPIRIDRLTRAHLKDLLAAIEERNELVRHARASRDKELLAAVKGHKIVGPATVERIRATLRKALNDAIRDDLLTANPATHLELPDVDRPKPILWTPTRVAHWKATGQIPGPVMVWTPPLIGQFLDAAADDRLYALFYLYVVRGLRRGEGVGLHWTETDIDTDQPNISVLWQIVQHGWETEMARPKTKNSQRTVALNADCGSVLRDHRILQDAERILAGTAWVETGLVFTQPDGTALHPAAVTDRFQEIVAEIGLPPVRLHDLRHAAATLALAGGAEMKVVQDLLGHANINFTADTYTSVLPELHRIAAENAAALIPRAHRRDHRAA